MQTSHDYIELTFTLSPELIEPCLGLLSGEGIEYFQEEENRLFAYLPVSDWSEEKKTGHHGNPCRFIRFSPALQRKTHS